MKKNFCVHIVMENSLRKKMRQFMMIVSFNRRIEDTKKVSAFPRANKNNKFVSIHLGSNYNLQ